MASGDEEKGKVDLLEDNRIDSGIDSFKSLTKDEHYSKPTQELNPDDGDAKDKLDSVTEERNDSAYTSSSITVDNITVILKSCLTPGSDDTENAETHNDHKEQEVNPLTTITDDGDTYVFVFLPNSLIILHVCKNTCSGGCTRLLLTTA